MKLFKYNQFLNTDVLNENLDKAKKFLKERYTLLTAAKELDLLQGELAAQIDHKEIRSVRLIDFQPDAREKIKMKLRDISVTPELLKTFDKTPEFTALRTLKTKVKGPKGEKEFQLDRDNIGWLSNFTYFYYFENVPLEDLSVVYRRLLQNKDILQNLTIEKDKGVFTKIQFDANFINENVFNNIELLTDGLDRLESSRKIKKMYDTLTPELKKSYDDASDLNKNRFLSVAVGFEQLGLRNDGTVDEAKRKEVWDSFFGRMSPDTRPLKPDGSTNPTFGKMVYQSTLKRYENIHAFIIAANGHLASYEMDGFTKFNELINTCNSRLGAAGVEKVFNENGILIIEVNSFAANQIVNAHTSHCIKDTKYQWDSYVENHDNKQYYIYNFHVPLRDDFSTIGITIEPGKRVRAAHNRPDHSVGTEQFKGILKKWEKEYDIDKDLWAFFLPMDGEEIRKRQKAKEANREIVKPGLSMAKIIEYVTEYGADINKDNAKCLFNAVSEDNYEKVELILKLGGLPNLSKGKDAPISKATNLNMIKLLVDYGSEMTSDVFKSVVPDTEALDYCLTAGLDPLFSHNMPLRKCFQGNYEQMPGYPTAKKKGEPYWESFLMMMKYLERKDVVQTLLNKGGMITKWATDYGRTECLEYFEKTGVYKKYNEKEWKDLFEWVEIARMSSDQTKAETLKFLKELKERNS
jgi:hypothetical protein